MRANYSSGQQKPRKKIGLRFPSLDMLRPFLLLSNFSTYILLGSIVVVRSHKTVSTHFLSPVTEFKRITHPYPPLLTKPDCFQN